MTSLNILKGKSSKYNITFGADPEFLILKGGRYLVPAWTVPDIAGTKGNPTPIEGVTIDGAGWLVDGVAVEINLPPLSDFRILQRVINRIIREINENNPYFTAEDSPRLRAEVDEIEVQKKYQSDPHFLEIGCTFDFDAYSSNKIRPPKMAEELGNFRFTGGHIHIGCEPWPDYIPKDVFIKFLDALYFPNKVSLGTRREQFYGMPGIYRETPYGVEYRTPNTSWIVGWNDAMLNDFQSAITRILRSEEYNITKPLVKLYNSGLIDEINESFKAGKYTTDVGNRVYGALLTSIFSERKLISSTPRVLKLEGWVRETELGPQQVLVPENQQERPGRDREPRAVPNLGEILHRNFGGRWVPPLDWGRAVITQLRIILNGPVNIAEAFPDGRMPLNFDFLARVYQEWGGLFDPTTLRFDRVFFHRNTQLRVIQIREILNNFNILLHEDFGVIEVTDREEGTSVWRNPAVVFADERQLAQPADDALIFDEAIEVEDDDDDGREGE